MTEENLTKTKPQPAPPAKPQPSPQAQRRHLLRISFIILVVFPTLLGTLYTTFLASDRYVAGAGFAIRSMKMSSGGDLLGAFTGLTSGGSTVSEAYMVLEYLKSRDLLDRLEEDIGFREIYGSEDIDVISRLRPNLDVEKVLKYWHRRIDVSFDPSSSIVEFEVQAFSETAAKNISELILSYTQELVEKLSAQARKDAVRYAESEVARAEKRQLAALGEIRKFRKRADSLDPVANAMAQVEILTQLEGRLLSTRTRMGALENEIDADAPTMNALRRNAEALEKQIIEKQGGINITGSTTELSDLLAEYEELIVEKEFSRKAYASSLVAMEAAQIEAGRQQRYLAVFSKPTLPEHPLYPRKVLYPTLFLFISFGLWGIGALLVYSIRDHIA